MQIDTKKLKRLEEAGKQAHAIFSDIARRQDTAQYELLRHELSFQRDLPTLIYQHGHVQGKRIEDEIAAHGDKANPDIVPDYILRELREIAGEREEVERLQAEHDKAQGRYQGVTACLPALRKFAQQCHQAGGL